MKSALKLTEPVVKAPADAETCMWSAPAVSKFKLSATKLADVGAPRVGESA